MDTYIEVRPLSVWERALSVLMWPISWLVSGAPLERPKGTYLWNRRNLTEMEKESLYTSLVVPVVGDKSVLSGNHPIRNHIPISKWGWKRYVVLESGSGDGVWYVGWIYEGEYQVSRVPISGRVRMLLGSESTVFFGIDALTGRKIRLRIVDFGRSGDGGKYRHIRFL
jgi:hypothetical protein